MTVAEAAPVQHVYGGRAARSAEFTHEITGSTLEISKQHGGAGMATNARGSELVAVPKAEFEPLLSAEEAAVHLRIHPKTLQRMARERQVPSIRMGKYWRFHLSTLDVWLRAQENQCSQPFCVKKSGDCLEIHA